MFRAAREKAPVRVIASGANRVDEARIAAYVGEPSRDDRRDGRAGEADVRPPYAGACLCGDVRYRIKAWHDTRRSRSI